MVGREAHCAECGTVADGAWSRAIRGHTFGGSALRWLITPQVASGIHD